MHVIFRGILRDRRDVEQIDVIASVAVVQALYAHRGGFGSIPFRHRLRRKLRCLIEMIPQNPGAVVVIRFARRGGRTDENGVIIHGNIPCLVRRCENGVYAFHARPVRLKIRTFQALCEGEIDDIHFCERLTCGEFHGRKVQIDRVKFRFPNEVEIELGRVVVFVFAALKSY